MCRPPLRPGFPAHAGMDPSRSTTRGSGGGLPGTRVGSDPCSPVTNPPRSGLPRTRGDGPRISPVKGEGYEPSPHTRAWTPCRAAVGRLRTGFPAHAGMDRSTTGGSPVTRRLPRTRGDGPFIGPGPMPAAAASPAQAGMDPCLWDPRPSARRLPPHTRGWTADRARDDFIGQGFPAHAGMDPPPTTGLPRTRGDGPKPQKEERDLTPASPHTRGWTHGQGGVVKCAAGFPAHAGMDPPAVWPPHRPPWLPRTRGDGPTKVGATMQLDGASPHTRGWTHDAVPVAFERDGFPAHAGMDPRPSRTTRSASWLPPHTRGWTLRRQRRRIGRNGFPAHAGMDPLRMPSIRTTTRLPPAHAGMDPALDTQRVSGERLPPHTRGWTLRHLRDRAGVHGFPAHAGMDR